MCIWYLANLAYNKHKLFCMDGANVGAVFSLHFTRTWHCSIYYIILAIEGRRRLSLSHETRGINSRSQFHIGRNHYIIGMIMRVAFSQTEMKKKPRFNRCDEMRQYLCIVWKVWRRWRWHEYGLVVCNNRFCVGCGGEHRCMTRWYSLLFCCCFFPDEFITF